MLDSNFTTSLPTLLSLTEDEQQQLASSVTQNYQRWKQSRARLESKWRECWEAYLCEVKPLDAQPDDTMADRSRIARPVLYEAVEAIHASLLNALFPANERFFTVMGKTEADHQQSKQIEEFIRTKLEDASFIEKYSLFLRPFHACGYSSIPSALERYHRQFISRISQKDCEMFLKKLVHFVAQKSLGNELALALLLLRIITQAMESHNVTDLARFVFGHLPENWRQSKGPATETEFVDMVQAGQIFLDKVKAAVKS